MRNVLIGIGLGVVCAAAFAADARAEEVVNAVVAAGESAEWTSSAVYGSLDVAGDLSVSGAGVVLNVTNMVNVVPGAGRIAVKDGASFQLTAKKDNMFVLAESEAQTASAVSVLDLAGPASVTMDVVNKSSATGCVTVSGAVTWNRRSGYKWGDGTFGLGGPWRITVADGACLTMQHGNQGGHLNNAGGSGGTTAPVVFDGVGDVAFAHQYNTGAGGAFAVNAGAAIVNGGQLILKGDKQGVFAFCKGARLDGPTNVFAQGSPCALRVDAGADVTLRNVALDRAAGDCLYGGGAVTVEASGADVAVAADVPCSAFGTTNALAFTKVGTHGAKFAVTNLPALTVAEGTATIANDCRIGRLVVSAGATLVVDGGRVVCASIRKDGEVLCRNGGAVSVEMDGTEGDEAGMLRIPLWSTTALVKTGDADLIVYDPAEVSGFVHVAGGALRFSKRGLSDRYFRLTFKECWPFWYGGKDKNARLMSKAGLFDAQDALISPGWGTNAKYGAPASELKERQVTAPVGTVIVNTNQTTYGTLHAVLIANNYKTTGYLPEFGKVQTNAADRATWQEVTARFANDMAAIDGLNFWTAWDHGSPRAWTVETSATGLDGSWRTVMDVADAPSPPNQNHWGYIGGDADKPACHFRYLEPGVAGLAETLQVRVDAGAVLDFSCKAGGQTVDRVAIDLAAGGGTVSNVVFAASGVVELTGTGAAPVGELPLVCADAAGAENLKNWNVTVGGAKKDVRVSLRDDRLFLVGAGTLVVVR